MKPALWMGLAAAGALSLYVAQQPDGDVEALNRHSGASQGRSARDGRSSKPPKGTDQAGSRDADPAAMSTLLSTLAPWQQRSRNPPPWPALDTTARLAWAAQLPPPPPPAEALSPAPPPPPMAPPFPHAWVGRYVDHAVRAVVAGPAQTWVVQARDVIDGQWRVDAIEGRQMRLTYLPLQQSQTVNLK